MSSEIELANGRIQLTEAAENLYVLNIYLVCNRGVQVERQYSELFVHGVGLLMQLGRRLGVLLKGHFLRRKIDYVGL